MADEARPGLHEQLHEGAGVDRERSGEAHVVLGDADRERRGDRHPDLLRDLQGSRLAHGRGDTGVHVERQVRAVLLGRADRQHADMRTLEQAHHLRVAHVGQPHLPHPASHSRIVPGLPATVDGGGTVCPARDRPCTPTSRTRCPRSRMRCYARSAPRTSTSSTAPFPNACASGARWRSSPRSARSSSCGATSRRCSRATRAAGRP